MSRIAVKSLALICALTLCLQGVTGVSMPCTTSTPVNQPEMSHHAHHDAATAAETLHAGHAVDDSATATSCCDGGYCSQGGCVSLVALLQTALAVAGQPLRPELTAAPSPHLTGTLSTPYRPPALA
ncbi:hypothetical protein F0M18_02725 [Pseudohalioglobus sediminis]|uniref:CopL family metal-binding regulatory protein n=1 Tax=Pseudohalioglobus sediminis TaxID=2606449 RepID=A0A5B0X548_9GAMM|nr:hypothetical protein [Pseudohalioglobus sediminis]KAA1194362.1 hypothetical protein F0M18_02725 [Pseudohalioglobus sediminis]